MPSLSVCVSRLFHNVENKASTWRNAAASHLFSITTVFLIPACWPGGKDFGGKISLARHKWWRESETHRSQLHTRGKISAWRKQLASRLLYTMSSRQWETCRRFCSSRDSLTSRSTALYKPIDTCLHTHTHTLTHVAHTYAVRLMPDRVYFPFVKKGLSLPSSLSP